MKKSVLCLLMLGLVPLKEARSRSDQPFEAFAYQGCLAERKYPETICRCNAKNLDSMLNHTEKTQYKKAVLGDPASGLALVGILNKLQAALQKCAQ